MTDPYAPPPSSWEPPPTAGPARAGRTIWPWFVLVGVMALVVGLALGAAVTSVYDHRDTLSTAVNTAAIASGTVDPDDLSPGDCVDESGSTADYVGTLHARPCTGPHDEQVFATFTYDEGGYPGDDAIDGIADRNCMKQYTANKTLAAHADSGQISWITPTEDTWSDGDRKGICIVTGPPSTLTSPFPVASPQGR